MGSFIVTIAIFMIVSDWSHTATGIPERIGSVGIRFSESDYRAEENAGAVEVLLVRSEIVPDDIILTVTPLTLEDAARRGIEVPDGVSTTRDDYVNYRPVEVVFPADSSITSMPVSIPIVNDDINEADERFIVVLESISSLVDLSGRSIAFCEISNDDDIAIGFEEEDYVLTEGQETTISIVKNRETEQEFAVHLEVIPDLAVLGVDVNITSRSISLVFPPSEEKLIIPIKAIDDSIPENVEILEMVAKYALPGTTLGTSCTEAGCHPVTKIKIIDNDVEVSLEKSNLTVREDAGAVTVCVLITRPTGPIDCVVNVYVTTQPGTAGETEFVETSTILTLHRLRNRQCFDVMIIDDSVAEETKVFTVYLSGHNTDRLPQLLYGETSTVISILDDEIVAFENKTYSVNEEDGFVRVCVLRIGDVIEDLTATISTADGTAIDSSDYVTKNTNIVFTSTSSHHECVPIVLVDDNIPEVPESFNVTLSTEGTVRDTATVTITDGDVAADPEKGCSVELYVSTAVQEIAQAEVVASIQTVLPSIPITAPTSSPGNTSTGTPDKEALTVLYESVVEKLGIVKSNATFSKFKEAVAEITEAHEEACSGPEELRPVASDIPALAQRFSSLLKSHGNGEELRTIFGKMLCLNDLLSTLSRRKKRQGHNPCPCPPGGLAILSEKPTNRTVCEFFKCLNEELENRNFSALFGFSYFECLAFVVDTTGSMKKEIGATKELIKSFVSSEEDEPACYVLTPFNDYSEWYMIEGKTPPGPDYGPATVYNTYFLLDLLNLTYDIEALEAHNGGGDCVEYGMSGLNATLTAKDAEGGDAMMNGSQAIVITDAGAKDDDKANYTIKQATSREVCVHFFFATPLPGCEDFGSYPRVADETGGTQVTSYDSFADLLGIITRFRDTYGISRCEYTGTRRRRQVEIDGYTPESRCHSFHVSELTTVLRIHIKTAQTHVTIKKSDNILVSVTIGNGYNPPYKETYPREGTWSACTSNGVLSILVEQQINFDATVSYVKKDDSTTVGIVATTKPPPACTEGQIAVFTSKHNSISSLHLNFFNEDLEVTQQVPLTFCGGAFIGNATFPLGSVTYQLEGEDTTGNPFTYRIKKKPTFQPGKYTLNATSGPQEVEQGNSTRLTFELKNLDYYRLLDISLTVEAHSGFINSISPTKVSVGAGESVQITVTVRAASSRLTQGSSYNITVAARSGCTELFASQTVKIKEVQAPPTSNCSCENGGTCYYVVRRGMTFERCRCPSGYGGGKCQIIY